MPLDLWVEENLAPLPSDQAWERFASEERRVNDLLTKLASKAFKPAVPVWTWTSTQGLRRNDKPDEAPLMLAPRDVLDWIAAHGEKGIFQLRDFHEFLRDLPEVRVHHPRRHKDRAARH